MAGLGTTVLATDVNDPGAIGVRVMGPGGVPNNNYGYGQTTYGSASTVGTSTLIAPGKYDNIRYDLLNASAHQNGTAAALTLAAEITGEIISTTNANAVITYANTIDSNRLTAHSSRLTTSNFGSISRTASWVSLVSTTYTLTFSSSNVRRYFLNAGGRVRISASRSGGSASSQNTAWSNLLTAAGTQSYGATDIYALTSTYSNLYSTSSSSPYASNTYKIQGKSNGTTDINFYIEFSDPYVDPSPGNPPSPDDLVDGTLTVSFELTYPTGGAAMNPSGNWIGFNVGGAGGYYALPTATFVALSGS